MGLRLKYIKYIEKQILDNYLGLDSLSMLELGDQVVRGHDGVIEKTGKEYFSNRGIDHTSIDLNGEHGSLKIDLSVQIDNPDLINHFDIITNLGTTEHIEPRNSQYECFENIHKFLKVGGTSIHIIPDYNESEKRDFFKHKHCKNYYMDDFFQMLSKENDYELLDSRKVKCYRWACVRKLTDGQFMKDRELFLSKISRRIDGRMYFYTKDGFEFK